MRDIKENKISNNFFNFSTFFNTEILFTKRFSKNDILFKQFLIKHIVTTDEKKLEIKENEIKKIISLPHGETVDSFLSKFCSKRIVIYYGKSKLNPYELSLSIVASYLKIEDRYKIKISDDFYKIFNSEKNDFKLFYLNILLSFSNTISRNLFNLLKSISNEAFLEISLEELKSYLNIEESYDRFFDFEHKILVPALKEIEEFLLYKVEYSKIKESNSKNSKIKGIRFDIIQTADNNREKNLTLLFELFNPFAKNEKLLQEFITKQSFFYSFNYLKRNIEYSLLHSCKNLDSFLIESIEKDYVNTRFKTKFKNFSKQYTLISNLNQNFTSLDDFRDNIFKEIDKKKLSELSILVKFMKSSFQLFRNNFLTNEALNKNEIYKTFYTNFQENNEFTFENKHLLLIAEFNDTCCESYFAIFKK
ncbi:RepB family plasmid replication initiator protein [uncultured Fusobacterium sp.]|jgi:hypothetical protein|uniref:RepB family plasmid replication initiator protein n=1 Tax=Fusobacterium sp. TaxID=68766 RepID=UPI0015A640E3|nr:RepB family plasmid replication initiator protein [uncultured Fusobacterium sp.]